MQTVLRSGLLALALLGMSSAPAVAKDAPTGTFTGSASATDATGDYGSSTFKLKNGRLVFWDANAVPRQCQQLEMMNYGFTVAPNVLQAYGLKARNVRLSKQGRLKFTYTQPGHRDTITVDVRFGRKSASGTVINLAGPGEKETQNCSGSAKVSLRK